LNGYPAAGFDSSGSCSIGAAEQLDRSKAAESKTFELYIIAVVCQTVPTKSMLNKKSVRMRKQEQCSMGKIELRAIASSAPRQC
jgi:hypothetical protein